MTILAVGDSLTYGSELPDLPSLHAGRWGNNFQITDDNGYITQVLDHPPSNLAWPRWLSDHLNTTVDNHGLIGCGNDRIFRRSLADSLSGKYELVVVAWSEATRYDFTLEGKEMPISMVNVKGWQWAKELMTNHCDLVQCYERTWCLILALQSHFQQIRQPYVFVSAMGFDTVHPRYQHLRPLWEQIDMRRFVDFPTGITDWTRDFPKAPHGHILEDGHRYTADRIYDYIQANQLLERP